MSFKSISPNGLKALKKSKHPILTKSKRIVPPEEEFFIDNGEAHWREVEKDTISRVSDFTITSILASGATDLLKPTGTLKQSDLSAIDAVSAFESANMDLLTEENN